MRTATVKLHVKTQIGVDALNAPLYEETVEEVPGVLIGLPSTDDITSTISLYGKRIEYMLGLPKGDGHTWTDTTVEFFGRKYRTFGAVVEGIESNIPTPWHKKVRVEHCE